MKEEEKYNFEIKVEHEPTFDSMPTPTDESWYKGGRAAFVHNGKLEYLEDDHLIDANKMGENRIIGTAEHIQIALDVIQKGE